MRTSRLTVIFSVIAIGSFFSTAAFADDEVVRPENSDWYGWEFATADAGAGALLIYARANATAPLMESWLYQHGQKDPVGSEFSTSAGAIGSGLYLGGAPVAHLANGQPLNAAASLGARVLLPLLFVQFTEPAGGTIGFFVRDSHGQPAHCSSSQWLCIDFEEGSHADEGSHIGADFGMFAGMASAMLIDQMMFSREPIGTRVKPRHHDAVELAPDVRVSKDLAFAGLGGRF